MQNMVPKKGSALPVRLTEEEKVQVAKIAEETGLTSSTLIRLLISSLVVHYRENNNSLTLPLRWKKLIAEKPLWWVIDLKRHIISIMIIYRRGRGILSAESTSPQDSISYGNLRNRRSQQPTAMQPQFCHCLKSAAVF